jgi:hypothetical protein
MTLSSFVPLAERIWEHGEKQKDGAGPRDKQKAPLH